MKENEEINRLPGLEKKDPFQTPEGYFESFNSRLRDRMSDATIHTPFRYTIPVLASLAIMLAVVFMVKNQSDPVQRADMNVTYQDLAESNFLYSMNEEEIAEAYSTMFHGTQDQDEDLEYMLSELDEETLSINL